MSVKNPLRNFGEIKSNRTSVSPSFEATNFSIQLTRIGKMLEESILNFTKRYLIISTELEENQTIANAMAILQRRSIELQQQLENKNKQIEELTPVKSL